MSFEELKNDGMLKCDDGYTIDGRTEWAQITAKSKNCEVVQSNGEDILLDIDDPTREMSYAVILDWIAACSEDLVVEWAIGWRSKGGNQHFQIHLNHRIDYMTLLFLQLALGSDPKREFLNLRRLQFLGNPSSILFRPLGAKIISLSLEGESWKL